ncbi:hypothetical protein K8I61_05130 [bacterium]|nr:hypothetical protein [bacterium]
MVASRELRQELIRELAREFSRGTDKTISARRNPLRWILLHFFVGLNVMVVVHFVFQMLAPWPIGNGAHFVVTFLAPAIASVSHFLYVYPERTP